MLKLASTQLQDPNAQARIEMLYALVMVQEVDALPMLTKMWASEQTPEVKEIVGWAGKQLHAIKQQGYSTMAAMRVAFRLDPPDKNAALEIEKLHRLEDAMRQSRFNAAKPTPGGPAETAGIALLSLAVTGGKGILIHSAGRPSGYNAELAGLNTVKRAIEQEKHERKRPLVPAKPTDSVITVWLKKLTSSDAGTRLSAVRQLADYNNPAALGPLGTTFVKDTEPEVRQAAQQIGLQIYFAALYWQNPPN